ncbi:hypothetical protein F2P81_010080 [Scophthalmus maximus]|uniref:Uncharacterized protein n=1 Tax=Scophthalmus maximus TaxID=52904 RepID=A0A6A4SPX8_SCOMX|nr:hypothetical protein F2P81_010080 [Scophthalmus maximus]
MHVAQSDIANRKLAASINNTVSQTVKKSEARDGGLIDSVWSFGAAVGYSARLWHNQICVRDVYVAVCGGGCESIFLRSVVKDPKVYAHRMSMGWCDKQTPSYGALLFDP